MKQHGCTARFLAILLASFGAAGCFVPSIDLEARECPCSSGWTCDSRVNRCVRGALGVLDAGSSSSPVSTPSDSGAQAPDATVRCPDGTAPALGGGCQVCGSPDCLVIVPDGGSDGEVGPDAGPPLVCPGDERCMDPDGDGRSSDGDLSGVKGDAPCRDGAREGCDDNCPLVANPWQDDGDNDGIGDACDSRFCRSSSTLVAVGYDDQAHVSTDHGQTWSRRSPGAEAGFAEAPNWEDVVYGRGTWITENTLGNGGTWARSVDGKTWTVKPFGAWQGVTRPQAVGYADGVWYLGSEDGRLAVSVDDGLNFTSMGAPKGWNGTAIESFAYHAGRMIAVGDGGQIAYSDRPDVASTWHTRTIGTGNFKNIVVVAGVWVAAGTSTCYYSSDRGEKWTSCGAPTGTYYGLHYSNGVWMLGNVSSGAWVSRGGPDKWTEQVFTASGGAWPLFGDCGSGRWFAGHRMGDPADHGLRVSTNAGRDPVRSLGGQAEPIFGITGN